ncbi:MAG: hypothetical protein KBS66_07235, partial [Eubacterium sp.]|nr:hypothetical protein [Candidatus Colimonas fimequi]
MKRKIKSAIAIITMAVTVFAYSGLTEAAVVSAADSGSCTYLEGVNANMNGYMTYSKVRTSFLTTTKDGYMRVQVGRFVTTPEVEFFDNNFQRTSKKTISGELSTLGAFYDDGSYYYLITGQENASQNSNTEVIRVSKFDKSWNKIGSASLKGANTVAPFEAGNCRVTHTGNYMVIRTSHKMYRSSDGNNHQANMTLLVNTSNMTITDSQTGVSNTSTGYVSHSFNQFVKLKNNKIVAVDQGDAYPRGIALSEYPTDVTSGKFQSSSVAATTIFPFAGEVGNNTTGATIGGFELAGDNYLTVGSSIVQDGKSHTAKNIFAISTNSSTKKSQVTWLTDVPDGGASIYTPQMAKINDNKFLVYWGMGTKVQYVFINGVGTPLTDVREFSGCVTDCEPIVQGSKVIWYQWKNEEIIFYLVATDQIDSVEVVTTNATHLYVRSAIKGTSVTLKCSK